MKINELLKAGLLATCVTFSGIIMAEDAKDATENALKAATAQLQEKAAVAVEKTAGQSIDALLKFIPEVVVAGKDAPILTRDELVKDMRPMLEAAIKQGANITAAQVENLAYSLADNMASFKLILKEADKLGIKANTAAAEEQLKAMEAEVNAQQPGFFEKQLKEMNMTREDILGKLTEQSKIEQYIDSIVAKVPAVPAPTEEQLKEFYEKNQAQMTKPATLSAAHILVSFPSQKPTSDEKATALAKAKEIRTQLKDDGSNFAELAKLHSACPSKAQGGDLGQFQPGQMVAEFEQAVQKMKEGEISQPVETIFGYHIIKAGKATPASTATFEEVKEQIKAYLTEGAEMNAKNAAVMKAVEDLKTAAGFKSQLPQPAQPMMPNM